MTFEHQEPIVTVERGDGRITLLGTAHVSRASTEKVRQMLATGDYDAVALELCQSRHDALVNPASVARLDLFQVLRSGKAPMVMASLALGAYQQRLAEQLGVEPGAEMRAAIESAKTLGLPLLLIDREVGITLKRLYRSVPWWQRLGLVGGLLASAASREKIAEADVERLKQGDVLEATFAEFAAEARQLYAPLIDERDRYMAARLRQEIDRRGCRRVLAVVGAGHLKGIRRYLDEPQPPAAVVAELDRLPPPGRWARRLPWLIVAVILTGFTVGFARSPALGWQLVIDWVLINGGLAALGAALAAAHPLTVASAFLAAPLTSLNPTVGAGMVTAAIELYLRRPEVGDFSRMRQDAAHPGGWWRNRVTRILLVFLFSTLGSAAGTYLAGLRIFERLV